MDCKQIIQKYWVFMKNKLGLLIMHRSSKQQRRKQQDQMRDSVPIKGMENGNVQGLESATSWKKNPNNNQQQHCCGFLGQTALFTFLTSACPMSPRKGPQLRDSRCKSPSQLCCGRPETSGISLGLWFLPRLCPSFLFINRSGQWQLFSSV